MVFVNRGFLGLRGFGSFADCLSLSEWFNNKKRLHIIATYKPVEGLTHCHFMALILYSLFLPIRNMILDLKMFPHTQHTTLTTQPQVMRLILLFWDITSRFFQQFICTKSIWLSRPQTTMKGSLHRHSRQMLTVIIYAIQQYIMQSLMSIYITLSLAYFNCFSCG